MNRKAILHVEGVPNPNAIKFVLENGRLVDEPYEFKDLVEAENSPLARRLLMLRYVDRVMINQNYLTVVKSTNNSPAWDAILFELRMLIQQHLDANEPILFIGSKTITHVDSDDVVIGVVKNLLDKHIRPAAQADGGDIVFESYAEGVLNLSMHGACHKCPYAIKTMQEGVEKVLMSMVPEVKKVTATANNIL